MLSVNLSAQPTICFQSLATGLNNPVDLVAEKASGMISVPVDELSKGVLLVKVTSEEGTRTVKVLN